MYWCTTNGVEGATLLSFLFEFFRSCQVHALHCGRKIIRVHVLKFYGLNYGLQKLKNGFMLSEMSER